MDLKHNRIKQIMRKQNLTQKELAEMTGISQGDLSKIIAGKKERLTLINAAKIAMALGFSIEYIWPHLLN